MSSPKHAQPNVVTQTTPIPDDLANTHAKTPFTVVINSYSAQQLTHIHAMDFALAAAAFGHGVMLIFQEDGLQHLINDHHTDSSRPSLTDSHNPPSNDRFSRALTQLELFDLAPIYLCEDSLRRHAVSPHDFKHLPTQTIDNKALLTAMQPPRHCLIF